MKWCAPVLLACLLLVGCAAHSSRIVLLNQMAGEVTHVKISWDGGEQNFDIVPPSQSVTVTMTNVATKGFTVEMTLAGGQKYQKKIPSIFDPQYTGDVTITVDKDGSVGWEEHFEKR